MQWLLCMLLLMWYHQNNGIAIFIQLIDFISLVALTILSKIIYKYACVVGRNAKYPGQVLCTRITENKWRCFQAKLQECDTFVDRKLFANYPRRLGTFKDDHQAELAY